MAGENHGKAGDGESDRIGLCADCRHMRQIASDRGSMFYLCQLSDTDSRFPKYPRLPVLRCLGHEASGDVNS